MNDREKMLAEALRFFRDEYLRAPGHLRLEEDPLGEARARADAALAELPSEEEM